MAKRRSVQEKFNQLKKDFAWLVWQGSEEGFGEYLKAMEVKRGTNAYDEAWNAWNEALAERESRRRRG